MQANIYSHTKLIGTSNLTLGDASMGCIYGKFTPNENYFKYVQPAVWEFWKSKEVNYKKWHSLKLNAQLENGLFLDPIGGYTIDDMKEINNQELRIDVAGLPYYVIENYFEKNTNTSLFTNKWTTIDIEQKIDFENQVKKNIRKYQPTLIEKIFKPNNAKHPLVGFECSAIFMSLINNDVIFSVHNKSGEAILAIVNLVGSNSINNASCPLAMLFETYESCLSYTSEF